MKLMDKIILALVGMLILLLVILIVNEESKYQTIDPDPIEYVDVLEHTMLQNDIEGIELICIDNILYIWFEKPGARYQSGMTAYIDPRTLDPGRCEEYDDDLDEYNITIE